MTSRQGNSLAAGRPDAVGQEQAYVDMLYALLDTARERTEQALARSWPAATPAGRSRPGWSGTSPRWSAAAGWPS